MSDEQAIDLISEPLAALTDEEEAVAWWLACSSVPGGESPLSIVELANQLGVHRNTITNVAKRPNVRAKAYELLKEFVQYDRIPKIMLNIWVEAEKDAKFGLTVLKFLREWGIDPFLGVETSVKKPSSSGTKLVLSVPGDFEAAIRTRRPE